MLPSPTFLRGVRGLLVSGERWRRRETVCLAPGGHGVIRVGTPGALRPLASMAAMQSAKVAATRADPRRRPVYPSAGKRGRGRGKNIMKLTGKPFGCSCPQYRPSTTLSEREVRRADCLNDHLSGPRAAPVDDTTGRGRAAVSVGKGTADRTLSRRGRRCIMYKEGVGKFRKG